jgi:ubiquinone/menaquinone biosynthesis C-methylase UbiE
VRPLDPYIDEELAALYDLDHASYTTDLHVYEEFARRGGTPSLELGAGSGRVALHLARQALDVVALDASPAMLGRLRASLDEATAPRVRVVAADMRDFELSGDRFDLIFCALGTFGHLLAAEDQLAVLSRIERHLSPGGVFVADLRSPSSFDWTPGAGPVLHDWTRRDEATGDVVTRQVATSAHAADQTVTYTIIFDRAPAAGGPVRRRTVETTLRVIGLPEVELLLRQAGLRLASVYGDVDLSPFDDASDRMLVVAQREDG